MNVQDLKTFGHSINETELISFEKGDIGFQLPDDYRSFLLMYNGGGLSGYSFYAEDIDQEFRTDVFYGLNIEGRRAIDLRYWFNTYDDEIPKKSLLIGGDPGGMHLLYVTKGEDKGIYLWDHAHRIEGYSEEEGNTYFIAESFEEFIKSLKKFIP